VTVDPTIEAARERMKQWRAQDEDFQALYQALKPCPFCGTQDIKKPYFNFDGGNSSMYLERVCFIECAKCHMRGPFVAHVFDPIPTMEACREAAKLWDSITRKEPT
jgi:hypothetical protein